MSSIHSTRSILSCNAAGGPILAASVVPLFFGSQLGLAKVRPTQGTGQQVGGKWAWGVDFPAFLSVGLSPEDFRSCQVALTMQLPFVGLTNCPPPLPLRA